MSHGWSDSSSDRWWGGPEPAPEFAMMPSCVASRIMRRVSGSQFKLLFALMSDAYRVGRVYAVKSVATLMEECGLGRATTIRGLHQLEQAGLIERAGMRSVGSNEASMYRVLVTADPRYVNRRPGIKSEPGGGIKSEPGPVSKVNRDAARSFLSIDKRGERRTHTARKYVGGAYGVCESCGCRPCACGEEVAR